MGPEQGLAITDKESVLFRVPYIEDTYDLSWLITVSLNRCSAALAWLDHVVSKLLINTRASGGPRLRMISGPHTRLLGQPRERVSRCVGAGGVAGLGLGAQLVQRVGCSSWTPNPRPAPRQARRRDGIPTRPLASCGRPKGRMPTPGDSPT